jgi:pimeloyl-ACP methyl ester carboxylesterase
MTFIRVFKDLAKRFRVHALDFLGMGLSHRKEYNH